MKTLVLRLVPYLISMIIGISIYAITDIHIKDDGLNGLMIGIASGLLSIPMIFISYELIQSATNKKLKSTYLEHISFEANHYLIDLLHELAGIVDIKTDLTEENLDGYLSMSKSAIKKHLNKDIKPKDALLNIKAGLDNIVHGSKHVDVLSADQLHAILGVSKEIGILAKCMKHSCEDSILAESLEKTFNHIRLWIELGEEDAFINHTSFNFINRG